MQLRTIDPTLDLCTWYPLRLGGPRQCGVGLQRLFDTSTNDQCWKSNPTHSDLESITLVSTWPRVPKQKLWDSLLWQSYWLA